MNILAFLKQLFNRLFPPKPAPPPVLELPHPEEPENPLQTIDNVSIGRVRQAWYLNWAVSHPQQFDDVMIVVSFQYLVPACTLGRAIYVRPTWLNKGVIAHEMAHVVWPKLTLPEKQQFADDYDSVKNEPLMQLMRTLHAYADTSNIEGHAECYRFLGHGMPEILKKYYPGLI